MMHGQSARQNYQTIRGANDNEIQKCSKMLKSGDAENAVCGNQQTLKKKQKNVQIWEFE